MDRPYVVMDQDMESPRYPFKPIHSLKALSLALGEPQELLVSLAKRSSSLYRYVPQLKKDGSRRDTYDAYQPLKAIQRKIVDRLFTRVCYPSYLHGGISDPSRRRSIYTNARMHAGAKVLVLQDIKDFFPSISIQHAQNIFVGVFAFSEEVACVLAQLTTREGVVPQGASTSGYIANLVFWDIEPLLVARLNAQDLNYSRFADDITISSHAPLDTVTISKAISDVTLMLAAKGCRQKRSKLHMRKRGQALITEGGKEPLTVTGLSVFNDAPAIPKRERKAIRAAVKQLEDHVTEGESWDEIAPQVLSVMGRIGRLIACKHPDGERLMQRTRALKARASLGFTIG